MMEPWRGKRSQHRPQLFVHIYKAYSLFGEVYNCDIQLWLNTKFYTNGIRIRTTFLVKKRKKCEINMYVSYHSFDF